MAGVGLPKLRWLLVGAVAAGVWVVNQDEGSRQRLSRPSEQKQAGPQKSAPVKPKVAVAKSVKPAKPGLPTLADRPPPRPQKIVTGSIQRPDKPVGGDSPDKIVSGSQVRRAAITIGKVRVRARPDTTSSVVATLPAGHSVWELARSGKWKLVSDDGLVGWVHADYLFVSESAVPRPVAAVPGKVSAD